MADLMLANNIERLRGIRSFPSLIKYLRDELDWPIESDDFEESTFDYTPEELGIDTANAAKIQDIKRLRPLSVNQPWGIFFVKFEPRKLPVVALRRILSRVALKKRASSNSAERTAWEMNDLLFVSNYGDNDERQISFAHFSYDEQKKDLPTLKVLGWDNLNTSLYLEHVATKLSEHLSWPTDENDVESWRESWRSAFTLRYKEVITTSQVLAVRLAELARAIRERIKTVLTIETDNGPITKLMTGFKEALVHDLDEDGFADMYAQTIAYGLLSARITNPRGNNPDELFSQMPITNPFLKELMETFLSVGGRSGSAGTGSGIDFDELGISDVVDLLDNSKMEAVIRDFGDKNPLEDPVIHFYELFLHEYDPKVRMQRGVFYTPRPVVSFIVRSVHESLRKEFGLEDGLADTTTWGEMAQKNKGLKIPEGTNLNDPFVKILDPATGTGTFLVEVINLIHKTMVEKWGDHGNSEKEIDQLWNGYVPKHLLPRLHGYELLMAPYAIAHMKIGLKLFETGYEFGSEERARIYLTNALEPAQDFSDRFIFAIPALAHEAERVNSIKRQQGFSVVIGNPPYSVSSYNNSDFIKDIMDLYKQDIRDQKNIQLLSDDYAKFIRFCHWNIEQVGTGIVSLITKNTYINTSSFKGMRIKLLEFFDKVYAYNLHGKLYEKSPTGNPDKNVFDIRVGVAILTLVKGVAESGSRLFCKDFFGERNDKYECLEKSLVTVPKPKEISINSTYYFFEDKKIEDSSDFNSFWSIDELFENKNSGVETGRDHFIIGDTEKVLKDRLNDFVSCNLPVEGLRKKFDLEDQPNFKLQKVKSAFNKINDLRFENYNHKPFYFRKIYYDSIFLRRQSAKVMNHLKKDRDNIALILKRRHNDKEYNHCFCTTSIADRNFLGGQSYVFPLWLFEEQSDLLSGEKSALNREFERTLEKEYGNSKLTESIFYYIYAILFSNIYRRSFEEYLKIDYPKIPFTKNYQLFRKVAEIGKTLTKLHLLNSELLLRSLVKFNGEGSGEIIDIVYEENKDQLFINSLQYFSGITNEMWEWQVGKNKPIQRFLKQRKRQVLSVSDAKVFCSICDSIRITFEKQDEIDELYGTILEDIIER